MVDLSKFLPNKKILSEVKTLNYNQICSQILSLFSANCKINGPIFDVIISSNSEKAYTMLAYQQIQLSILK